MEKSYKIRKDDTEYEYILVNGKIYAFVNTYDTSNNPITGQMIFPTLNEVVELFNIPEDEVLILRLKGYK